jgi:hydrogenase maturation protease
VNAKTVEEIANAVLYEGYILYPYRPSALKNRRRFNFGVLAPKPAETNSDFGDAWAMRSDFLVAGSSETAIGVKIRFLQLIARSVGKLSAPLANLPENGKPTYEIVDSLHVAGRSYQAWQEAVEREVGVEARNEWLLREPRIATFSFPERTELEPLREMDGRIVGVLVRKQEAVRGEVELSAVQLRDGLFRVALRVRNFTPAENQSVQSRDELLNYSLVSTHAILTTEGGQFNSLLDPPAELAGETAECQNSGYWPVLVGEEGEHDTMLVSPIILYDYPKIAPESAGDLCDGTEIDEILALRILTMTDEEKEEVRNGDDRARRILERTESLPEEQFMKLHGALRSVRPLNGDVR